MENNQSYWKDKEYIKALESYSEFNQICRSLNEFDIENQWAFDKRNWYTNKMNEIKKKYTS